MQDGITPSLDVHGVASNYNHYRWRHRNVEVLVLHTEPFRIRWAATKLLTFVFLIPRRVQDYAEIIDDYSCLLEFARDHKLTWLPLGFHCAYALLPIYIGTAFDESLKQKIRSTFKERWCVMHIPSLLDIKFRDLVSLANPPFAMNLYYFSFITETISGAADAVFRELRAEEGAKDIIPRCRGPVNLWGQAGIRD